MRRKEVRSRGDRYWLPAALLASVLDTPVGAERHWHSQAAWFCQLQESVLYRDRGVGREGKGLNCGVGTVLQKGQRRQSAQLAAECLECSMLVCICSTSAIRMYVWMITVIA